MKLNHFALIGLACLVVAQCAASVVDRSARRREHITAANELAAHSTTERRLAGQLQVATRYIYQGQLTLEKELRDRPAALKAAVDVALEARHDSGTVTPTSTVSATSVRFTAGFGSLDTSGYHIQNDVVLEGVGPILGARQVYAINYDVELAPARYRIRVSCEGANVRVGVAGPRWRAITIDSTSRAAEDVCNPAPSWQPFTFQAPSLPWAAGLLTVGGLIGAALAH